MDLKTLNGYLDAIDTNLSGTKGKIDVGSTIMLIKQLKTRTKVAFDVDLAYNLASCVFFTDSEELNTYSMEANKKKIAEWREAGTLDFFMVMPVRELLGLKNTSIQGLMTYLQEMEPVMTELNSAMQTALSSEGSTSNVGQ
jgi:hypothetical protein